MTVGEIIQQVKWCIDHETTGYSKLQDGGEDTYMDNIIRAKIDDARRWLAVVSGQCTSVTSNRLSIGEKLTVAMYGGVDGMDDVAVVSIPDGIVAADIKRVRVQGWHKAAVPVVDTEDDALMMFDATAKGTLDRPLATLMAGKPLKMLVQPYTGQEDVEIGYTGTGGDTDIANDKATVDVGRTTERALIYYIAYLLLTAYGDGNAQNMLAVAMQMIGGKSQ